MPTATQPITNLAKGVGNVGEKVAAARENGRLIANLQIVLEGVFHERRVGGLEGQPVVYA